VFLREREIVHCNRVSLSLTSTKWPSEIGVFLSVWVAPLGLLLLTMLYCCFMILHQFTFHILELKFLQQLVHSHAFC